MQGNQCKTQETEWKWRKTVENEENNKKERKPV